MQKRGIDLVVGSMFSGKSDELLERIRHRKIAGDRVQLFKPVIDNRYSETQVVTHYGPGLEATVIEDTRDLVKHLKESTQVVGIDEIEFLDDAIIEFCLEYSRHGLVIASGLSLDFRREPFKFKGSARHMGDLMPHCRITQKFAVCTYKDATEVVCGAKAFYTQRFINGQPAPYDSPLVLIGGKEAYEARCIHHHFIDKPMQKR